jgi:hypothetical protein
MTKYECVKDFTCEVCNVRGLLQIISGNYVRVRHYTGLDPLSRKPRFLYHRQSQEYLEQKLRESKSNTSLDLNGQDNHDLKTLKCVSDDEKVRAGSSVRYECLTCTPDDNFEKWIFKQYSRGYAKEIVRLTRKYGYILQNPSKVSDIMILPSPTRRNTMAGLANLAKFNGVYRDWKQLRENSGLKWESRTSLDIVLDIINSPLKDIMEWLEDAISKLPMQYGTVLVFNALTGLRVHEGINACKLCVT